MKDDPNHRIFGMSVASVYVHYVTKVEKKGRTRAELDQVIRWLTGLDETGLQAALDDRQSFRDFFDRAPALNPARTRVTGMICGVRIEEIGVALMKEIRIMDKLVDELAKGRPMEKILRG